MIAFLLGQVTSINTTVIELNVNGVGYEIEMPISDIMQLQVQQQLKIFTHLLLREDASLLYGFLDINVRNGFRKLIKISGIGAKTALIILSKLSLLELQNAIITKDVKILSSVPSIGKKTAERMLLELDGQVFEHTHSQIKNQETRSSSSIVKSELSQVLEQFGYGLKKIDQIIDLMPSNITDTADAVKWALKQS